MENDIYPKIFFCLICLEKPCPFFLKKKEHEKNIATLPNDETHMKALPNHHSLSLSLSTISLHFQVYEENAMNSQYVMLSTAT